MNTGGSYRDLWSSERSLEVWFWTRQSMLNVFRKICQLTRRECFGTAKDLVALNLILEKQKRELAEWVIHSCWRGHLHAENNFNTEKLSKI